MSRKSLPKSVRFEVFKRDSFTCQYCGRKAPDVMLQADHIHPVSHGGTDDILNLITSCADCNSGKSDRTLSDSSVVEKQHKQLTELQERKEQIEMMFQWQKGLLNLSDHVLDNLCSFWSELVPYELNECGKRSMKTLLKKFGVEELMTAMKTATDQYVKYEDGEPTHESVEKAWEYVSRISSVSRAEKDKPYLRELFYIRGILRKRVSYVNEALALQLLERSYLLNATVESLRDFTKTVRNWTEWRTGLETFIIEREQAQQNNTSISHAEGLEDSGVHAENLGQDETDIDSDILNSGQQIGHDEDDGEENITSACLETPSMDVPTTVGATPMARQNARKRHSHSKRNRRH